VDHPNDWLAVLQQGHERAEKGNANCESCRAVHRIEDPAILGVVGATFAKLLPQNGVLRPGLGQSFSHGAFGLPVGLRHLRAVGLVAHAGRAKPRKNFVFCDRS
jgi:hypothetical protein